MGGYALNMRGSTRDTHDVDVAVGCTMMRLIEVLSPQPRVIRPVGPVSGVMRIFVQVGGQLDPSVAELWVTVDIILRGGSLGAPDHPQISSELVTFDTGAGQAQLPVIDILNAMSSKLNAYYSRQGENDYRDIFFLFQKYPEQIFAIRTQLDVGHRQYFVTSWARRNPTKENTVRNLKHVFGVA